MKPRVFIGSSVEGLNIAEFVKFELSKDFECYLWTDEIFKYNDSFLQTLLHEASLFDYGILIATKDDSATIRKVEFETPRDNIIFEFGLFLGRLGAMNAFVIQEKGTKLPSDLLGVTVPQFEKADPINASSTLKSEIERIRKAIIEKVDLGQLGLLPSTVLAIGYYLNLVQIVCESIHSRTHIEFDGKKYKKFKFFIVMPKDLDSDIKRRAMLYYKEHNYQDKTIDSNARNYPIHISTAEENTNVLEIYDMPTTLSGLDRAIELYMRKGFIGKTSSQKLLEERELRNFQTTLEQLIQNDSYCKSNVSVIFEA